MQDLLSDNGKFLSHDEFKEKFGLKVNYLQYFQITAAIQSSLKQTAMQTPISAESLFSATPYPKKALYLCLKCVVNTITSYLMSALCRNLLELKDGKNISQTGFLTGKEILPGYIRLPKIISLGNSYLRYYKG